MYVDSQLCLSLFTAGVVVPWAETTVAEHVSPNVINLTHIPRTIIENVYLVVQCAEVPVSAGGGTLTLSLVTSAAVGLTAPQVLWNSGLVANATIVAYVANTTIYAIRVPASMLLQYLGVILEITVAVWTAGSFRMFLTPEAPYYIPATP